MVPVYRNGTVLRSQVVSQTQVPVGCRFGALSVVLHNKESGDYRIVLAEYIRTANGYKDNSGNERDFIYDEVVRL